MKLRHTKRRARASNPDIAHFYFDEMPRTYRARIPSKVGEIHVSLEYERDHKKRKLTEARVASALATAVLKSRAKRMAVGDASHADSNKDEAPLGA